MTGRTFSRRTFLSLSARAATIASLAPLAPRRALAAASAVPAGVIVRNDWPEHWETTIEALDRSYRTPIRVFFVRSHLPVPELDPLLWRLEVSGLVERPRSLSLTDLRGIGLTTREVTLECAGNGRGLFALPNTSGTQWERGAVGHASWTGVPLKEVLKRARVKPEAQHVWLECADRAPLAGVPPFLRSLPLEKAMRDVLLAWDMNGAPLTRLHGAPLRVVVPGWFGMASAKWLVGLRVESAPSDNHFMVRGYRWNHPGEDPATAPPVESMRVKSLITWPREGADVRPGDIDVRGVAWTGEGTVTDVHLGVGESGDPIAAKFLDPAVPGAWRRWTARVTLATGRSTLRAVAKDSNGEAQPAAARVNNAGYGNNSIHEVSVHAS